MEKIRKQLDFLIEIDKVKGILRQSLILQGERRENDAEHSWHMALAAMTLREYFMEKIDMEKVLKMILIHDIVEIYAGDNPAFGAINHNKFHEELEAANKIFGMLPGKEKDEFLDLWLEFEEENTPESKFATACDRFQGFMQNLTSDGHTWKKYSVHKSQVEKRMEPIKIHLPEVYKKIVEPEIHHYMNRGIILHDLL
ncbi:MAG: HD domain-containing protein [Fusobacteriaceae bacterium]